MPIAPETSERVDILVAEDSLTQAFALKALLERNRYRVAVVENGREVLEFLRRSGARMVISDIDMPELDGYAMCLAVKNDPALRDVPIILLTTLSNTEHILQGLKAKADYYLTKPYDPPYLLDRVKTLLERPPWRGQEEVAEPLEISLEGERHQVEANRRQMLNLLLSTYENAVQQNRVLTRTQAELNTRNQQLRDQTERLQMSEANIRNLLRNMADGMVVTDRAGVVRFVNAATQMLFGQSTEELLDKPFEFPAVPGETREVNLIRPGRDLIVAELRAHVTVWEGEPACLVSLRDITQRKLDEEKIRDQQEKLQEANEKLKALATSDGLTGLKNHRTFKERLTEEFRRATHSRKSLSLLLLDVDHFKAFNDTHGHPAGDEVLRQVAKLLAANARETDLVARYGGEEFAVLMPETDRSQAVAVAERIRRGIETAPWRLRNITVSVGVSTRGQSTPDGDALVAEADQALYHSKQNGRNRVTHTLMVQRARMYK
ncbi:MAG TPA: diguanylate cyclase [Verrucomicrobiae bacterium]|nr:diguanylate cyclase [Verrucomicrobiae bacterium]